MKKNCYPTAPKVPQPKQRPMAQHSGVDRRKRTFTGKRPQGGAGKF